MDLLLSVATHTLQLQLPTPTSRAAPMRIRFIASIAGLPFLILFAFSAEVSKPVSWSEPLRGIPLITSFDIPPTRHSGEVWGFAPAAAGQVWVGSDELILFNGESREKIELPFETYAVRGLAHDADGKLWIGGIGDIGHLERTETGGWRFVSAHAALHALGLDKVRVWEAQQTPDGVVFVTDEDVLRWDGGKFERWPMPSSSRLRPTRDRDRLWIVQPGVGLFRMEKTGPRSVYAAADLPVANLSWAVGSGSDESESLLVGGPDGIFRRLQNGWVKLEHLSTATSDKGPWRAVRVDARTVAIGTVLGGVVIGTIDDHVLAVIDRTNGLANESVTSLWLDERSDQLWIGHVGGMARVDARGATSVFDTRNGLNDSAALKTLVNGEKTYVLARHGLSVVAPQTDGHGASIRPIPMTASMPLSDVLSSGPNLWLSGLGGGIWKVNDERAEQETPLTGFIFGLVEAQAPPHEFFYLQGTEVWGLVSAPQGRWETRNLGADTGAIPISAVRDISGDLWISTVTRGIFRYRVVQTPDQPLLQLQRRFHAGSGLPLGDVKRPVLTTVGTRVFLLSDQTLLGYDRTRDAFVPLPGLERFVALAGTPSDDPTVSYWVVRDHNLNPALTNAALLIRLRSTGPDTAFAWEALEIPALDQAGRISGLSFTGGKDPALWIAGSLALLRQSIRGLTKSHAPPPVELRGIQSNGEPVALSPNRSTLSLAADTTQIRITLDGIKRTESRPMLVQALLKGVSNEWSKPQADAVFEFTGLRPGAYDFQARAVDRAGQTGPVLALSFVLRPPWYRTAPAIWAYNFAALLAVVAVVRWRVRHLRRLNQRLNQLVDERTAELGKANAARNEFLEAISHEIRNPLNGITNLVDLLHDAKLDPEAKKLAGSLGRSAAHLKQVFGDVLGYAKLEYGHVDVARTPFSLKLLLEDTLALFAVQAREKQSELRLILPAEFADGFTGDADKIQSVISNYVSNALKYAPGGPIEVILRIATQNEEENLSKVWLGVLDRGPGIREEEQALLFKKFSRGQGAKSISGTGLGLAICRGIADLMDGKVGVTSQPGHGSTFWLEIPLVPAPMPTQSATEARSASKPPAPQETLALIVDDLEYNQAVLRGIAQRLGYRSEVASCADDVWLLIEKSRFGVVFLDWELPGLSGGDIARRLRTHPHARDAVIIATTAHDTPDIVQKCLDAGMDGFAAKPFDTAQITEIVADAVSRHAGRTTEPRQDIPADQAASTKLTLTAFTDFAAGDPARAQQAVALYLQTLDQEIAALVEAIGTKDREMVARRAHRLRSHAGLVNGTALNTAAQRLALAARGDESIEWSIHTQAIFEEAAALKIAITRLANEPISTS
ncbi:MAG: ATP-binding protein [Opitutaceae bacterium]